MNILSVAFHIILLTLLLYLISVRLGVRDRFYFWIGAVLKIAAGISVGWLYFYYYGEGDTVYFFRDAKILSEVAKSDFGSYVGFLWSSPENHPLWEQLTYHEARSNFFVKFTSLISYVTADNYWLIASYLSFFSFLGSWYLFRKISLHFPKTTFASFVALLAFPSLIFWTSGFIKESIANAALMYVVGVFISFWFKKRPRIPEVVLVFLSLWLLWSVKYHYVALLVPVIVTSLVFRYFFQPVLSKRSGLDYLLWSAMFIIPILIISLAHPNFNLDDVMSVIVFNYDAFQKVSDPDDVIHFYNFQPDLIHFMMNAPVALLSGLFRPTLFDAANLLHVIAAIENLFILILTILSFRHFKCLFKGDERLLLWSLMVYVFLLCIGITFATPNFGTLSRYRVGYMPFFLFLVMWKNPVMDYIETRWNNLVPSR